MLRASIGAEFATLDRKLSSPDPLKNLAQSVTETLLIFAVYSVVSAGRFLAGDQNAMRPFAGASVWVWVFLFVVVNTILKTAYPRFDEQLVNGAFYAIVLQMSEMLRAH